MADRSVRSLVNLQATASTARTLNLNTVWKRHGVDSDWRNLPLFFNPVLNRSIIVKHRLRPQELDLFSDGRQTATKVILPINDSDLKFGGRYFFVDQRGYADLLDEVGLDLSARSANDTRDLQILEAINGLPSLDPFLMREVLARKGFKPSRHYFDITEADMNRMFAFLRNELQPLIGLSFDDLDVRTDERTSKLAAKILANTADEDMEPFRIGLGMNKAEFEEGIFCWKGFIYYKWVLNDLVPRIKPVAEQIARVRPVGTSNSDDRVYITKTRAALDRAIKQSCATVWKTLKVYDDAYADLTRNGRPDTFRDFLQTAPSLFYELGERLGGVQHIVTFWRYRFPERALMRISVDELIGIFMDFEATLGEIVADNDA